MEETKLNQLSIFMNPEVTGSIVMKHIILLLFFLFRNIFIFSQEGVRVCSEKENENFNLYMDNANVCPVSIVLKLTLLNIKCIEPCPETIVVPQKSIKFKMGSFAVADLKKPANFNYTYKWTLGDMTKKHDDSYGYYLPFEKGKQYLLIQGYNGQSSHKNQNSLDFNLPQGSIITAAREGVVAKVIDNNTQACPEERCKQFNNYVQVYHTDGSFAEYTHVIQGGSMVTVGNKIKAGQPIARSGNTGYSAGPHLHFMVYKPNENDFTTIETKFKVDSSIIFLKPGEKYVRNYD